MSTTFSRVIASEHVWSLLEQNRSKIDQICQGGMAFHFLAECAFFAKTRTIAYPEAHGLFAGHKPPEAALAADKTSVVSAAKTYVVSAAAKTSVERYPQNPKIQTRNLKTGLFRF